MTVDSGSDMDKVKNEIIVSRILKTKNYKRFEKLFLPMLRDGLLEPFHPNSEAQRAFSLASFLLMSYGFNAGSESRRNYYRTNSYRLLEFEFIDFLLKNNQLENLVGHKFEQRDFIRYCFTRNEDAKTLYECYYRYVDMETEYVKDFFMDLHSLAISFAWE